MNQNVSRGLNFRIVIPPVLQVELGRRRTPSSETSADAASGLALQVFTNAPSMQVSATAGDADSVSVFAATARRHPKAPAAGLQFGQDLALAPVQGTAGGRTLYTVSTP